MDSLNKTIFDLRTDPMLREELLDTMESMLKSHSSQFRDIISYVLDYKIHLFTYFDKLYENEDYVIDLILPTVTRLYGKYFVLPPSILNNERLELYKMSFDIDEFLNHLLETLPLVKNSLFHFQNLERTNETLSIIVDNYIAGKFKLAYNSENVEQDIRDIKLKKLLKNGKGFI